MDSFRKVLSSSEVGSKKMNDRYLTFKSKVDYLEFYGRKSPNWIEHIDKSTKDIYVFRYDNEVSNGEVRLYEMGKYYYDKEAIKGDEIIVEKIKKGRKVIYQIDILKKIKSKTYEFDNLLPDEVSEDSEEYYTEGSKIAVLVNRYERNTEARTKCIDRYGAICYACSFDFEDNYGEIGKGFIHVHHLVPISEIKESYVVNPIADLIPVCPNCHAMIHKRTPPYSIEEIKKMLE